MKETFRRTLVATILSFQCVEGVSIATVWGYGCEGSIRALKNAQQDVESAHSSFESAKSEVEFAKSMYNLCTPTRYDGCEFQRMNLNNAVQEHNDALAALKSRLTDFEYAVRNLIENASHEY